MAEVGGCLVRNSEFGWYWVMLGEVDDTVYSWLRLGEAGYVWVRLDKVGRG